MVTKSINCGHNASLGELRELNGVKTGKDLAKSLVIKTRANRDLLGGPVPGWGTKILHAMECGQKQKQKKAKKKNPRTNIAQHPQRDRWLYAGADVISILQKKTLKHRGNRPEIGSKMLS